MNIRIKSEDELIEKFTLAIHIMSRLKFWTDQWNEKHGGQLLQRKKYWEGQRDKFLSDLNVPEGEVDSSKIIFKID